MGYLCLSCYNEYNREALNLNIHSGYEYLCPNAKCGDISVVEIDDLILPIIKLLNSKGYMTDYCCSGHCYENKANTYISFYDECIPETLPKGFYLEDEKWYQKHYIKFHKTDEHTCMRKYYSEDIGEYTLHKELLKTMNDLLEWAIELPDMSE